MIYYGLWWGGSSYSPPTDTDLEVFTSLEDAKRKLRERYENGYWHRSHSHFVFREPTHLLTPAVDEQTEILLYAAPDDLDYPFKRIYLGPRGGVRVELT